MEEAFSNESQCINMAIEGNLEAFNCLVTYYQTAVYNTALHILCDHSLADDITQTAFINAWKHIDSFSGGSFKPWILKIAYNACCDELRRQRRHPEQSLTPSNPNNPEEENEDAPWLVDPRESPVEEIERKDRVEAIRSCFEALPPDYRAVFVLIDLQGLNYQTVEDILKIPLGTVKSRIRRARERMKGCLKSKGNF